MIKPNTKREEWGSMLHISKNQLVNYLKCPRQYYYQYLLALPWEATPAYVPFGSVIHETVAEYYRSLLQGRVISQEDLLGFFEKAWAKETNETNLIYDKQGDKESYAEMGMKLLVVFYEQIRPRRIEAVELPFSVDIIDPATGLPLDAKLVGIIDLLESDENGTFIISDLKTASRRYSDNEGENKLDGTVYAYAMNKLGFSTADETVLIRYDVLVKTKQPQFQQVYFNKSQIDLTRFLTLCKDVLRAIDLQVFYRNEGWQCKTCPFRGTCLSK